MLKRFLTFVSEALLCFPSPHFGRRKRSLVQCKRPDKDLLVGSRVFREALGPWAGTVCATTPAAPSTYAVGTAFKWAGQSEPSAPSAPPLPSPVSSSGPPPVSASSPPPPSSSAVDVVVDPPEGHHWKWREASRRYICCKCLDFKRVLTAPDQRVCPGFCRSLHAVASHPSHLGHTLYLGTYTAEPTKFLVVCQSCGGLWDGGSLQSLKRQCPPNGFTSAQQRANWSRAAEGKHPRHAKHGDARVLDPLISMRQALRQEAQEHAPV